MSITATSVSLGWYEGELVRRIDPQHRSLGRFFAEEIAAPLGLDVHFGVPDDVPRERIADRASAAAQGGAADAPPAGRDGGRHDQPALAQLPRVRQPAPAHSGRPRPRQYRHVEFPAGGAVGSARGVARAYSAFTGAATR